MHFLHEGVAVEVRRPNVGEAAGIATHPGLELGIVRGRVFAAQAGGVDVAEVLTARPGNLFHVVGEAEVGEVGPGAGIAGVEEEVLRVGQHAGKGPEVEALALQRQEVLTVDPDGVDRTLADPTAGCRVGQHQVDCVTGVGDT